VSRVRIRGWWMLALLAVGVMLMPWPAWLVEAAYSRGFYPRLQRVVTAASNRASLAIVDFLLVGLVVYVVFVLIGFFRRFRERGPVSATWELARRVVRTAAIVGLVFLINWGLNYRRRPLEHTIRGGVAFIVTPQDIRSLTERAIAGTLTTRPSDDAPVDRTFMGVAARLSGPFQQAVRHLGLPDVPVTGRPKVSQILTPFYTKAGVTGMVNPFALESIVHPGLLPFERPMVMAHEWAHLAGFADEADASAVAWLACTLGDADLAYSAHLNVVLEAASALPAPVWRELRVKLSPGVVEDINALRERLTQQTPAVRDAAFKVYDQYLKSNGVQDGVRSYSRMLRVLVAMETKRVNPLSSQGQ
jgi:hypothetical protein